MQTNMPFKEKMKHVRKFFQCRESIHSYILHNIYLKLTFSFYVTLRLNLISVMGGKAESVEIMRKHFKEVVKGRDIDWSSDQNQKHLSR